MNRSPGRPARRAPVRELPPRDCRRDAVERIAVAAADAEGVLGAAVPGAAAGQARDEGRALQRGVAGRVRRRRRAEGLRARDSAACSRTMRRRRASSRRSIAAATASSRRSVRPGARDVRTDAARPSSPAPPAVDDPVAGRSVRCRPKRTTRGAATSTSRIRSSATAPLDLVFVMGWVSHLEYFWKEPTFARFLRAARVVLAPDPVRQARHRALRSRAPRCRRSKQRMDDVRAVMDAVGSERAALLGVSEGGPMCSAVRRDLSGEDERAGDDRHLREADLGAGLSVGADARRARGVLRRDPRPLGRAGRPRGARAERRRRPGIPRRGGAPTCAWARAPARRCASRR